MGFFGKEDPPEDIIEQAPTNDTEKQLPSHHSDENDTALPPTPVVHIDLAVEKRMLRKLDCRLPLLLGFLCMWSNHMKKNQCY